MEKKENVIRIEIYYSENGVQYEGFDYLADTKIENRDVAFLVTRFLADFYEEGENE
jgi:hypothetical protein